MCPGYSHLVNIPLDNQAIKLVCFGHKSEKAFELYCMYIMKQDKCYLLGLGGWGLFQVQKHDFSLNLSPYIEIFNLVIS